MAVGVAMAAVHGNSPGQPAVLSNGRTPSSARFGGDIERCRLKKKRIEVRNNLDTKIMALRFHDVHPRLGLPRRRQGGRLRA